MSLMGIDIGTTGCKAAVFDSVGTVIASDYCEYDVIRRLPGQAELDSSDVWNKVGQVISSCAGQAGTDRIEALSAASMGEALVPVDSHGRICGNSILGTDTRGTKYLDQLIALIPSEEIYRITGQPAGTGYSLPNLCRIKAEEPELYHAFIHDVDPGQDRDGRHANCRLGPRGQADSFLGLRFRRRIRRRCFI